MAATTSPAALPNVTNGVDHATEGACMSQYCEEILKQAVVRRYEEYMEAASSIVRILLLRSLPRSVTLQLRKQMKLLDNVSHDAQSSEPGLHQSEVR